MKKLHILIPSLIATASMPLIGLVGCNKDPDVPVGGPEAYIMDGGTKHEITSLIESHICDNDDHDIICDDGTVYNRGEFNLPVYVNNTTVIYDNFLSDCKIFNQKVSLPDNLKVIGVDFMSRCASFNQPLTIPDSVTHIDDNFMETCYSFNKQLKLSNNLISIGEDFMEFNIAFNQPMTLPNSLKTIDSDFMTYCESFNSPLTLSKNLVYIGDQFLDSCTQFNQQVIFPSSLLEIGEMFMDNCKSFDYDLMIPNSVEKIGSIGISISYTKKIKFAENSHLVSFSHYGNSVYSHYDLSGQTSLEYIDNRLLYNHNTKAALWFNGEGSVFFPDDCEIIGDDFLSGYSHYNDAVILPNSAKTIGNNFMSGCVSFNSNFSLPDKLQKIGNNFMIACQGYNNNIDLPDSLKSVGSSFMYDCQGMKQTVNINNLQPEVFCQSLYTLSTENKDASMYYHGINIAGKNAASFVLRFPNLEGEKIYDSCYRKLRVS